jgi:hypothetical protein
MDLGTKYPRDVEYHVYRFAGSPKCHQSLISCRSGMSLKQYSLAVTTGTKISYDNYDEPDDREPPRSWSIIRDPKSYRMTRR